MKRPAFVALLVLSLALPATAAARQQQGDTISKALVELLFEGWGGPGGNRIVEGKPDDFPAELIPDGAIPRVAMSSGRMATLVVEAPEFNDAARPRFERKLAASGWTTGVSPAGSSRGLMSSTSSMPKMFCNGNRHIQYTTSPRSGGGSWVRVIMMTGGYRPCDASSSPSRPHTSLDDAAFPQMPPPVDAFVQGSSETGSSEAMEQRIRLETTRSAVDVGDYYIGLLTQNGWKLLGRAAADGIVIARFAPPSKGRHEFVATLGTVSVSDSEIDVSLQVFTSERRLP